MLIELPFVTVLLITIATTIYCTEKFAAFAAAIVESRARKRVEPLRELHQQTYDEIRTEFDFWWNGEPVQSTRNGVLNELPVPADVLDQLPQGIRSMMVEQKVDQYRSEALHLAAHARMRSKEDALLAKLPSRGNLRATLLEQRREHEDELEQARTQLLGVGIDVEQLEKQFAPA